jgi:hypothetical protein
MHCISRIDLFFLFFDQRMKGMQNKNNAQDIKDVYVRQYRALHHYFIFDCFVGFGHSFSVLAFRHETNLSCCTVFWTSKEAELR